MITFRCPYAACARRLSAPDDKAGRKATCPSCRGAVWVPVLAPGYSQPPVRPQPSDWPAYSATPQGAVLGDYEEEPLGGSATDWAVILGVASVGLAGAGVLSTCLVGSGAGEVFPAGFVVLWLVGPPLAGFACAVAALFEKGNKTAAGAGLALNTILGLFWLMVFSLVGQALVRHRF